MGGQVSFQSVEGEGSQFKAVLPFPRAAPDAVAATADAVTTCFRDRTGAVHIRGAAAITPGQAEVRGVAVAVARLREVSAATPVLIALQRPSLRVRCGPSGAAESRAAVLFVP